MPSKSQIMAPTYPSNAWRFLDRVGQAPTPGSISDPAWQAPAREAKLKLDIILVGAGLGGLATAIGLARTGHRVRVYESAPAFGEVGAGIQVPPNSTRYLLRWGVGPHLEPHISEPFAINLRRWQDGSLIGCTKLRPEYRQNFGAPYFVIHRADYHSSLLQRAIELGVQVESNAPVEGYEFDGTSPDAPVSIVLRDGRRLGASLVVAADGLKSIARRHILGPADKIPSGTGNAAYRGTVDVSRMAENALTASLLETPNQNVWMGHDRHVMTYVIGGKDAPKRFNMVFSHPEPRHPSTWDQEHALEEMKSHFDGWDPTLVTVMGMLDKVLKWPLMSGQSLERWTHEKGRLIIVGDAAHVMVPYMSQGAAIAVEDGAALSAILALIEDESQITEALRVFEEVRIRRSSQMQHASLVNGEVWHFPDGPEQRARDDGMRAEVEGRPFTWSPNQWSDPTCQWWTYGYEADKEVEKAWVERLKEQELV